jgi:hypothetical protein
MTPIVFSTLKLGISIQRDGDSTICSGRFEGASIKSAIPLDNGARCILLLDPDASSASVFENLVCIDRGGDLIWRARLPTGPDVFVAVAQASEGIVATTWSGLSILLDVDSGREQARSLVK